MTTNAPTDVRERVSLSVRVRKVDNDERLVYGEVYLPNTIDTHGEMMLPADLRKLAHAFIADCRKIDVMHDGVAIDAHPVESFIAREGDPLYVAQSWVLVTRINDDTVWQRVKAGELNGYSLEAWVYRVSAIAVVETVMWHVTETEESAGHTHHCFVNLSPTGSVVGGVTSEHPEDGHSHVIKYGTATEDSNGHSHRFALS